jgi:excisionase family DNA binding protein
MTQPQPQPHELLTPAEVAAIMRVDPKTVTRWAKTGKIRCIKTLGGHRRFFAEDFRIVADTFDTTEEPKW